VAQAFWVIHCPPQVSRSMSTIATLPLVTASLILGLYVLNFLMSKIQERPLPAPSLVYTYDNGSSRAELSYQHRRRWRILCSAMRLSSMAASPTF
jgi:hypothetical protein